MNLSFTKAADDVKELPNLTTAGEVSSLLAIIIYNFSDSRPRLWEVSSLLTWCICMLKRIALQAENADKAIQTCNYACLVIQESRKHGATAGAPMTSYVINMQLPSQTGPGPHKMAPFTLQQS